MKEWDIPLWDSDAAAENVPAGVVPSEEPWAGKVFRVGWGYSTPALPQRSHLTLSSSESEN